VRLRPEAGRGEKCRRRESGWLVGETQARAGAIKKDTTYRRDGRSGAGRTEPKPTLDDLNTVIYRSGLFFEDFLPAMQVKNHSAAQGRARKPDGTGAARRRGGSEGNEARGRPFNNWTPRLPRRHQGRKGCKGKITWVPQNAPDGAAKNEVTERKTLELSGLGAASARPAEATPLPRPTATSVTDGTAAEAKMRRRAGRNGDRGFPLLGARGH